MTAREYMDALAAAKARACKDYDPCHSDQCICMKCGESMEAHGYKWTERGPVPATLADLAPGIPGFTREQVEATARELRQIAALGNMHGPDPAMKVLADAAAMLRAAVGE